MSLKSKWSLIFLITISLLAIAVPFLSHIDPHAFDPNGSLIPQPPSTAHFLGTDELGRDLLIRCIYGAQVSLAVGFISVGISLVLGIIVGIISGMASSAVDELIMRIVDFFLAIPTLFLILIIQSILSPSIWNVMIVIGATSWMGVARLVRAEVLTLKERSFILYAKARGIPTRKILFKHLLPHTLHPVIVAAMLGMGSAILTESVLSFLGLGVQPPQASWGNMLQNSLTYIQDAPWMALSPGILITLTVLSLNFMGDYFQSKIIK